MCNKRNNQLNSYCNVSKNVLHLHGAVNILKEQIYGTKRSGLQNKNKFQLILVHKIKIP